MSFITFVLRQSVKILIVTCGGLIRDFVTGTALSTSKQTAEKLVGFVSLMVSIWLHYSILMLLMPNATHAFLCLPNLKKLFPLPYIIQ